MNKELEEAINKLNNFILETNKIKDTSEEWHGYMNDELHELKRTAETILQALDNSISKEKVKDLIETIKNKRLKLCHDNTLTIEEKNKTDKILVEIHKSLEKSIGRR